MDSAERVFDLEVARITLLLALFFVSLGVVWLLRWLGGRLLMAGTRYIRCMSFVCVRWMK